jgi:hypothetical protein
LLHEEGQRGEGKVEQTGGVEEEVEEWQSHKKEADQR